VVTSHKAHVDCFFRLWQWICIGRGGVWRKWGQSRIYTNQITTIAWSRNKKSCVAPFLWTRLDLDCRMWIYTRHMCVLHNSYLPRFHAYLQKDYIFRAKNKLQASSLPNTFLLYSMRQWCMKNGLHSSSGSTLLTEVTIRLVLILHLPLLDSVDAFCWIKKPCLASCWSAPLIESIFLDLVFIMICGWRITLS